MQSLEELVEMWEKYFWPRVEDWDEMEYILDPNEKNSSINYCLNISLSFEVFFRDAQRYYKDGYTKFIISSIILDKSFFNGEEYLHVNVKCE